RDGVSVGRSRRMAYYAARTPGFLFRVLLILWAALAIHFSNLPWPPVRTALAIAFAIFSIWVLWFSGTRRRNVIFSAAFAAVVAWWIAILPSHDRNWRPEAAVLPHAIVDGDIVRIENVRDFEYRSREDFTPRYMTREVRLSH